MNKKLEILAPGGDVDSIKAAIYAGAGAIYCGIEKFNARTSATNLTLDELGGILTLAHQYDCKIFLTLNIVILEQEIADLIRLLNTLINTKLDGIIVQDLGLFYILSKYFKRVEVHASTQVNTHNSGQIKFLQKLGVKRTNFSRELSLPEIKQLTTFAHSKDIETEVFVHGSYCIGFSGLCYMSSLSGGNSGNRGRCAQPCRDQYQQTTQKVNYPFNLKDNSAFYDLGGLVDAGVDSLKIEGRIKKADYVYTVVNSWKKQIEHFSHSGSILTDNSDLYKVFNRDFSNAYLADRVGQDMFIDNPRSHTTKHFSKVQDCKTEQDVEAVKQVLYNEQENLFAKIYSSTVSMSIEKIAVKIDLYGELGRPLKIVVKTKFEQFEVVSSGTLVPAQKYCLDLHSINKRMVSLNSIEFKIEHISLDGLAENLFISFKEQTALRNKIAYMLNGKRDILPAVELPKRVRNKFQPDKTKLSILISSMQDIAECNDSTIDIFFKIPNSLVSRRTELTNIFIDNRNLIPWFPAVLMENSFIASIEILRVVKPNLIVTNNLGIAYEASALGILWIAGPFLNITNSLSLQCLQERFNCCGAFISNELKKNQIANIKAPENFKLYYSIYHPISLLTSKQCLFLTTSGCHKQVMDSTCLSSCAKNSEITNIHDEDFIINKRSGEYNSIYSDKNFLNTEIVSDFPQRFFSFMVDLSDIKTKVEKDLAKKEQINLFKKFLARSGEEPHLVHNKFCNTTNVQYVRGI